MNGSPDNFDQPAVSGAGPAAPPSRNGIDSIDVDLKTEGDAKGKARLAVLTIHTFQPLPEADRPRLKPQNVRILGRGQTRPLPLASGPRIVPLAEEGCTEAIQVVVADPGNGLTYTLSLIATDAGGHPLAQPFPGFDPYYARAEFVFRDCFAGRDCAEPADACIPSPASPKVAIDYLAKDYASFRRLMLDRLTQTTPGWADRLEADLGVTVVEILAYVADRLSYYQDAVGTEAYLDTARRRISVRRHARLVDYRMHEGCNARAWVCLDVKGEVTLDLDGTYFFTDPIDRRSSGPPIQRVTQREHLLDPSQADRVVFAPIVPRRSPPFLPSPLRPATESTQVKLHEWHNRIRLRPHGEETFCLPRGATSATLLAPLRVDLLQPGSVLLFEEVLGPHTGNSADADPTHRHVVRLTRVLPADAENREVDVVWHDEDALPFPLCLRAGSTNDVSVAHGNVVLVDHGLWQPAERLRARGPAVGPAACTGKVARADRFLPLQRGPLTHAAPFPDPVRLARLQTTRLADYLESYRICAGRQQKRIGWRRTVERLERLLAWGLTGFPLSTAGAALELAELFADDLAQPARENHEPNPLLLWSGWSPSVATRREDQAASQTGSDVHHPAALGPARDALLTDPCAALPVLSLISTRAPRHWTPRADLLSEPPEGRHFVAEIDDIGRAHLRFDDDTPGQAPEPDELSGQEGATHIDMYYRVGNGSAGNVGVDTIRHVIGPSGPIANVQAVRNPLPASGGIDPEPLRRVKAEAPTAFRDQLRRAVTTEDYARLAERDERVQRAAAQLIWTGTSWEAQVAIDLKAEAAARAGLRITRIYREIEAHLNRYRRIGHDVRVVEARLVPLDIELCVQVRPQAVRAEVVAGIRDVFSSRQRRRSGSVRLGFFHPDRLTFGQSIASSVIEVEALTIPGISSVEVVKLKRLFDPRPDVPALPVDGLLVIGPMEIPQLDLDSQLPERGRFRIQARGGR